MKLLIFTTAMMFMVGCKEKEVVVSKTERIKIIHFMPGEYTSEIILLFDFFNKSPSVDKIIINNEYIAHVVGDTLVIEMFKINPK